MCKPSIFFSLHTFKFFNFIKSNFLLYGTTQLLQRYIYFTPDSPLNKGRLQQELNMIGKNIVLGNQNASAFIIVI